MTATVWTARRKWMGNLIPCLVWIGPTAWGIRTILVTQSLIGPGLWYLLGADLLAWLTLNQFGLYHNARMKRRLLAILGKTGHLSTDRVFVGFTTPRYTGLLDAHEDVGFLCFSEDQIDFVSETRSLEMKRDEVFTVQFKPNVHTMVGLGRWICIQGVRNQTPIRMLIEPRERRTMAGNLFYGPILKKKIEVWLKGRTP